MIQFVVATKWAKINNTGPGYINYTTIESILQSLDGGTPESEVLAFWNLPPENFDRQIYENYYIHIQSVQRPAPILYETVEPNIQGVSYSVGVYDAEFTDTRDQTPRTQFLGLLNLTGDRVAGNYEMDNYVGGFNGMESVYNTLKNA